MSEPTDAAKQWKSRETTTGPEVLINGEWITPFTSKLVREHNRMLAELTRDKERLILLLHESESYMAHAPVCRDESVDRCDCGYFELTQRIDAARRGEA